MKGKNWRWYKNNTDERQAKENIGSGRDGSTIKKVKRGCKNESRKTR